MTSVAVSEGAVRRREARGSKGKKRKGVKERRSYSEWAGGTVRREKGCLRRQGVERGAHEFDGGCCKVPRPRQSALG